MQQPDKSVFHKLNASFSRPLTQTIMSTWTTSFPDRHIHTPTWMLTENLPPSDKSLQSVLSFLEEHCCDIHFCTRFWWLALRTIAHFSHWPPTGYLLLASNRQALIRKLLLSTCYEWNFKHNNSDAQVKTVVNICPNKTWNKRNKTDTKGFYVFKK